MTAFQILTFIPRDGNFSITLPEHLRETNVELSISAKRTDDPPKLSKEEYLALMNSFWGTLRDVDYSDLREETDREL